MELIKMNEALGFESSIDHFHGVVEYGRLTASGLELGGWAANRMTLVSPSFIIVTSAGRALPRFSPTIERPDLPFSKSGEKYGFKIAIPLSEVPEPLDISLKVYAIDDLNKVLTELPRIEKEYHLELPIKNAEAFRKLVQQPSTRIKDSSTLTFVALHAAERFHLKSANSNEIYNNYITRSAAACVLGYRLLEIESPNAELSSRFNELANELIEAQPDIQFGVYLRWNTSLRLLRGYWAIRSKNYSEAIAQFEKIYEFAPRLEAWPSAVSNILIAVFLLGYLAHKHKDDERASDWWSRAAEVFQRGVSVSNLVNFYAYEEIKNATSIAQECFVGSLITKFANGRNNDQEKAPIGRALELARIPNFNISNGALLTLLSDIYEY